MSFLDHAEMPFDGYLAVQEDPTWMEYQALEDFPPTQIVSDEQTQDIIQDPNRIVVIVKETERPSDHHDVEMKEDEEQTTTKQKKKKEKNPATKRSLELDSEERMLRRRLTEEELTFRVSLKRHQRDDREFWQLLNRQRLRRERETRQDQLRILSHIPSHLTVSCDPLHTDKS